MTALKPLPEFKSEEEEAEFWSTHCSVDYIDWNAESDIVIFRRLAHHRKYLKDGPFSPAFENYQAALRREHAIKAKRVPMPEENERLKREVRYWHDMIPSWAYHEVRTWWKSYEAERVARWDRLTFSPFFKEYGTVIEKYKLFQKEHPLAPGEVMSPELEAQEDELVDSLDFLWDQMLPEERWLLNSRRRPHKTALQKYQDTLKMYEEYKAMKAAEGKELTEAEEDRFDAQRESYWLRLEEADRQRFIRASCEDCKEGLPGIEAVLVEGNDFRLLLSDDTWLTWSASVTPTLEKATHEQREYCEIHGHGHSLHWPEIDEDLELRTLLEMGKRGPVEVSPILTIARKRLEYLMALPEDWKTYGLPTTPVAADASLKLLTLLRNRRPSIVPRNGGVQLEWHAEGFDLELVIDKDGDLEGYTVLPPTIDEVLKPFEVKDESEKDSNSPRDDDPSR
jgi:hypothetical protein